MKNIIFVFLILLTSCFSNRSFGQAQPTVRTATTQFESLENTFEVRIELLSGQQLDLFQKKSEQQLQDFVNLVDLLSSNEWKPKLKKKLNEQGLHFFTSPNDSLFFLEKKKLESVTIEHYLEGIEISPPSTTSLTISESTPPLLEKNIYSWTLNFEAKKTSTPTRNFMATLILKQEEKKFGKEKKNVWDVKIKEIREIAK